jgi:MFS family permease
MSPENGSMRNAYRGWFLALLFLSYALYALDRSVMLVLVEPIKKDLGFTDSQMGIIIGPAFSIVFAVCGIPLGMLADRRSRRNIVAACLALWSVATGACGLVSSFLQMAASRMVVGGAISGGTPAAMSIISDIFKPERRATAMSIYYAGGSLGAVLSFGIGSIIAANHGWRAALYTAAAPGLIVAALLMLTVREPERGASESAGTARDVPVGFRGTLAFIWKQKSAVHILIGLMFLHAVGNGGMSFFASFMIRSHGMGLKEAGGLISLLYLGATPLSQVVCGMVADYLGKFDSRYRVRLGWLGSLGSFVSISVMMLAGSKFGMGVGFACWAFSTGLYQGPLYAMLQSLVGPRMRGTIGSLQFVLTAAIGGAVGPLFVGTLSDALASRFGTDSLRYALLALGCFYLWACVHFILSERRVGGDLARVQLEAVAA